MDIFWIRKKLNNKYITRALYKIINIIKIISETEKVNCMTRKIKLLISVVVISLLGLSIYSTQTNAADKNKSKKAAKFKVYEGKTVELRTKGKAADFTWEEHGKTMKFSEVSKGKIVFVNFWGTWCPPCRRELPDIVEISEELKDKDFMVIGIPLERDRNGDKKIRKVKAMAKSKKLNYYNIVFTDDALLNKLIGTYGPISGVPTTFILGKDGTILEKIGGMQSKAVFMSVINKYLK